MGQGEGDIFLPLPMRRQVFHHSGEREGGECPTPPSLPSFPPLSFVSGWPIKGLLHFSLPLRRGPTVLLLLQEELQGGEDIARCPSCSLRIRVIADEEALAAFESKEEGLEGVGGN
jgi:hypothetical protein